MVIFLFSVHTIIEAKQYAGQGRAEQGLEPGRWIFQPGHLTGAPWCSAATVIGCGNVVSSSRAAAVELIHALERKSHAVRIEAGV